MSTTPPPPFIAALQRDPSLRARALALREANDALARYRASLDDWKRDLRVSAQPYFQAHEQQYKQLESEINRLELDWSKAVVKRVPLYRRVSPTQLIIAGIVAAVVLTMFVLFIAQLATNPLR
ncbi:hypothetical protein SEA_LILDESTINE_37 [Mycobacterium phage LilDestine]|uniref:hypothetical protein n=1 Tax=Mycobacterium phage Gardann TaxID=1873696 RepID=UPI0008110F42|nr:hypothetical protein BI025_gp037 [Mycobacterium phage Gardann]ANU79158.1 hypothetical protein SEA_GARDANN_37 [Mycobacterium phage Gardann]ASR87421.1 hypothetical protein SEA_NICHOLASP3_37 [Mycobacterium phage Nicholasp3]AYD84404.1 hypothetical protein SEA_LILDESTINE_37 [Mycobacterium phage LilDestine]QGZ16553.1 hypothetical protein PBI_GABRIELA_37 [Mycobacterium phage Gabriela]